MTKSAKQQQKKHVYRHAVREPPPDYRNHPTSEGLVWSLMYGKDGTAVYTHEKAPRATVTTATLLRDWCHVGIQERGSGGFYPRDAVAVRGREGHAVVTSIDMFTGALVLESLPPGFRLDAGDVLELAVLEPKTLKQTSHVNTAPITKDNPALIAYVTLMMVDDMRVRANALEASASALVQEHGRLPPNVPIPDALMHEVADAIGKTMMDIERRIEAEATNTQVPA
ncbi:hypothetical protein [Myxococcus virescens]|uniref:Uncharacterized protein n=1 Tax=Myxococcus virescens TaxID=83456 RepID=A0A511HP70_9BACT|nr:hypothetical protein [Myxococcus virescens]GEL75386.1 hypothetical protein MVI01_71700 [Myxococcus virescens]SDE65695.1 hypothetical protein SAMN04488504_109300 [Myxococcus virescens]